jgi:hypothetical protein
MTMSVRSEVHALAALGPMPPAAAMTEQLAAGDQVQMHAIAPPLNRDEAELLMTAFEPDDGYGVAWTRLHLMESAPTAELSSRPSSTMNGFTSSGSGRIAEVKMLRAARRPHSAPAA